MKLVFQTSVNPVRQKTQAIIKKTFEEIGIEVELKAVNASVYFSSDPGNPDTFAHFSADVPLFDQIATTLAFIGYALPTFFTGLLFIMVFSITLGWLPFIYSSTIEATGLAWVLAHMRQGAMPIAVLGLFEAASLTRFVRAAMLEVINQDYVRTSRAKGLSEWRTVLKHALRNALIPVVTIVALQIPTIFTGAVITEQIFRVPGIGSLLIASIESTDTPVVMAITFVYALLVIVFNVLADMIYGILDPRITYR